MKRWTLAALLLAGSAACNNDALIDPGVPSIPNAYTAPAGYEAIDLGTLGGYSTTPLGFNDRGQVVGYSDRTPETGGFNTDRHAFLWENDTMYDLELLPGNTPSSGQVINSSGQVAGIFNLDSQQDRGLFLWDSLTSPPVRVGVFRELDGGANNEPWEVVGLNDQGDLAVNANSIFAGWKVLLWRGGVRQELPGVNLEGEQQARALNQRGQVVGWATLYERGSQFGDFQAALWDNGQARALGSLAHRTCPAPGPTECGFSGAEDVNENGVVIGWSHTASFLTRAFRWENGVMSELDGFPGQPMWALAINDRGQIAGEWGNNASGGYFWDNGVTTDLGSLGGGVTHPLGISEDGDVVGTSVTAAGGTHAFLWRDGQMIDFGLGPSPIGAQASAAIAINNRGDVLGVSGNCERRFDGSCNLVWPMRGILWRKIQP